MVGRTEVRRVVATVLRPGVELVPRLLVVPRLFVPGLSVRLLLVVPRLLARAVLLGPTRLLAIPMPVRRRRLLPTRLPMAL